MCRRQKRLQVQLNYHPSQTPLHLLVDSTDIKFLGEGDWKRKKHGAEYRRHGAYPTAQKRQAVEGQDAGSA